MLFSQKYTDAELSEYYQQDILRSGKSIRQFYLAFASKKHFNTSAYLPSPLLKIKQIIKNRLKDLTPRLYAYLKLKLYKSADIPYYTRFKRATVVRWPQPSETVQREPFAIIVPYRSSLQQDRTMHLERFVAQMNDRIAATGCDAWIIIVEQSADNRRFNRGQLLNIGFNLSRHRGACQHIFHDIDLLPDANLFSYYGCPCPHPLHLAAGWEKYQNLDLFFGGVTVFSTADFEQVNGYPNDFWGWGGEDEELYHRVVDFGLSIAVPMAGIYQEMSHLPTKEIPSMVNHRRFVQIEQRTKFGKGNGLAELAVRSMGQPVSLASQTIRVTVELKA